MKPTSKLKVNGFSKMVVIGKTSATYAGQENINILLILAGLISFVEIP
jgi:hypothetical protein